MGDPLIFKLAEVSGEITLFFATVKYRERYSLGEITYLKAPFTFPYTGRVSN